MASSTVSLLLLVVHLLVISSLVPPACSTSRRGLRDIAGGHTATGDVKGVRVDLIHVDAGGNFSKIELIQRGIKRAHQRLERLTTTTATMLAAGADINEVGAPVHSGNGEYLMSLSIGTPPLPFSAILDTGSDLIWTQCKPCQDCFKQSTPIFDPSNSKSFSKLPCSSQLCQALPTSSCTTSECDYTYSYGDYSATQGYLAIETFTFSSLSSSGKDVTVPGVGFGCGEANQGSGFSQGAGLVGLGRGPLSLISQLGSGKFSYCLTSIDASNTSPLLLGSEVSPMGANKSQVVSTPLIKNSAQPSFYYLKLNDITVGGTLLRVPQSTFQLQEDGSGGVIIDSGTTITYLEKEGYGLVKKAFIDQVKLDVADGSPLGLDLCFSTPSGTKTMQVPNLILHFDQGGDLEMPADNYMVLDSDTGLLCLMMMESSGMSILGNIQQQNMQVVYDLDKEMLSFVSAQCDQL